MHLVNPAESLQHKVCYKCQLLGSLRGEWQRVLTKLALHAAQESLTDQEAWHSSSGWHATWAADIGWNSFYKCSHFRFFNNHLCCRFLPHPSSWRTAPHCCKTLRAAKHSCTSLRSLLLFLFIHLSSVVCVCVWICVCACMHSHWYIQYSVCKYVDPMGKVPRSSLIQNLCVSVCNMLFIVYVFLVCVCVWLHTHGYLPECTFWSCACVCVCVCVCVTVYCMQPCEAVRLLAASRLVFPKQAAGLWLRYVCECVCVCVRAHLFDSDCVRRAHAKFSLTVVCPHTCLSDFVYECVCLSACVSVCLFPSPPVW